MENPEKTVIELGSSEDEFDWRHQAPPGFPYGPPVRADGIIESWGLRRSKRIWHQVDKNNGKRVRYFEKRKRRRHNQCDIQEQFFWDEYFCLLYFYFLFLFVNYQFCNHPNFYQMKYLCFCNLFVTFYHSIQYKFSELIAFLYGLTVLKNVGNIIYFLRLNNYTRMLSVPLPTVYLPLVI